MDHTLHWRLRAIRQQPGRSPSQRHDLCLLFARRQNGHQQALTWNYENRLSSVTSSITESYDYDVDGQRIRKLSSGVYTYYPNQYYEATTGSTIKYYYFGNQRITQRNNGTLYYLHADQVGSTVLTASAADATEQFRAYGAVRGYSGSNPSRYQFTGQYIDNTGLYYNARYYDPLLGTFLSPDTLVTYTMRHAIEAKPVITSGANLRYFKMKPEKIGEIVGQSYNLPIYKVTKVCYTLVIRLFITLRLSRYRGKRDK